MAVAAPGAFSVSVRDVAGRLGEGPVTAWQIIHALLRDHPGYGGGSLLPLDRRPGRTQPVAAWLREVEGWYGDGLSTRAEPVIDGRMTIFALCRIDPDVGAVLDGTRFGERLRADVEAGAGPGASAPPPEPEPVPDDATEWQSDRPESERDLLGRRPLAAELASRLCGIHSDGDQRGSFVVHLDGPWGSGKSTILNYLREELADQDWLVVEVNAWRERRVRPAWYTMLTRLRQAVRADAGTARRRAGFWVAEHAHRLRSAGPALWVAVALTATLLTAVLALGAGWITTVLGLVATLFAAATLVGRTLFWDSAGSARFFERANPDPMERVARHVSWLLRRVARRGGRPALFLIEDLDRCDPDHVVELLEAVQNLVRDRAPDAAGPYVVVAADGAWVRHCYEQVYAEFREPIGTPGQPLGYLFLDKLVQLSLPVPRLTPQRQAAFLRGLLGSGGAAGAAADPDALAQVRAATDEGAVLAAVAEARAASPRVQEEVVSAAVRRLGERRVEAADRHALEAYAAHLPPNPRAMKRFVNAYGLARAVHVVEFADVAMGPRAVWTILRMRWPALADALRDRPELSSLALDEEAPVPPGAPADFVALLRTPAVSALLRAGGEPFDADMVRRVSSHAGG